MIKSGRSTRVYAAWIRSHERATSEPSEKWLSNYRRRSVGRVRALMSPLRPCAEPWTALVFHLRKRTTRSVRKYKKRRPNKGRVASIWFILGRAAIGKHHYSA